MSARPKRVLWMHTHGGWRNYEAPMLIALGCEVFAAKHYQASMEMRSASIDYAFDASLSLPRETVDWLNEADFYAPMSQRLIDCINEHFDVAILPVYVLSGPIIENFLAHFRGPSLIRVAGREEEHSYTEMLEGHFPSIERAGKRCFFSPVYDSISEIEHAVLRDRSVTLPLGLPPTKPRVAWEGGGGYALFVCPDVVPPERYYGRIYRQFCAEFRGVPTVVAGSQWTPPEDSHVLGFTSRERYETTMRRASVMYYHSRERRHCHLHPFEAVRMGMPLVYMRGGIIDDYGGDGQPGACDTAEEARSKVERLIDGDADLRDAILAQQHRLLAPYLFENCKKVWEERWPTILHSTGRA